MKSALPLLVLAALPLWAADPTPWWERMAFWAWGDYQRLEGELARTDAALAGLAELALVNSCIRVGLKTGYTTEEDVRWIELTLKETTTADTVVLVPPLAKGANAVVAGYGFPVRFKVEVFDEAGVSQVVMDRTQADFPNPGCFPVVVRFSPRPILKVRLTATEPWTADGPEVLALAEMMVMAAHRNVALEARVDSSSSRNAPRAWTRANLTDMITPLGLPQAPQAGGMPGFHSAVAARAEEVKWITLELPEPATLDEVRLVPVRLREVPLWFDYGFPVTYKVEAALTPDFSEAIVLHRVTDRFQPSPGMNWVSIPAGRTPIRYLRLTATQLWYRRGDYVLALAEIQAMKDGQNLAARGTFTSSDELTEAEGRRWSLRALADGLTENGRLLELPEWFAQLEQRRELEAARVHLLSERTALAQRSQHQLISGSVGGLGSMALALGFLLVRQNRQRRRETQRLRDKLARDLHDEIGSNLGSITLLCSFASQPDVPLAAIRADIAEIGRVAEETADSMRDMVDLLGSRSRAEGGQSWLEVLRRLTERLLRGLTLDCALPAEPLTEEPDLETRRELYLFCKEVLHNIARHARASRVRFYLTPTREGLRVEIRDNGIGFDPAQISSGNGLGNLRERAAAMSAQMKLTSTPGRGTYITLDLPRNPRWPAASP